MTIKEQLKDYIARNLLFSDNGFKYDDDDSFLEEGIVDSIGVLELVAFVDESFGVGRTRGSGGDFPEQLG